MQATSRLVVKDRLAAADLDVVDREARRRRGLLGLQPFVEQVGDVVLALGDAGHGDARPLQANFVDHDAELEQREAREIDEQLVKPDDLLAALGLDRKPGNLGRQGIGIDIDALDADLAMQFLRQLFLEQPFQRRRPGQVAERTKGQQQADQPEDDAPRARPLECVSGTLAGGL